MYAAVMRQIADRRKALYTTPASYLKDVQPPVAMLGSFWRYGDKPLRIIDFCYALKPPHAFIATKKQADKSTASGKMARAE